jgi:polygalacturonase
MPTLAPTISEVEKMALRTDLTDATLMANVHADQHNTVNGIVLAPGGGVITAKEAPVNVFQYGAKGDGATDDSSAFNAAITAAVNGVLYIPPGTYRIGAVLNANPVHIIGAGVGKTILQCSPSMTSYMWLVQNVSDFSMEHLTIDMNSSQTVDQGTAGNQWGVNNQMGMYVLNLNVAVMSNITLRNVRFINSWHKGLDILGEPGYPITNVTLENISISNCASSSGGTTGDMALYIGNVNGAYIRNLQLTGNCNSAFLTKGNYAGSVYNCTNFIIDNARVTQNVTNGVSIGGSATAPSSNFEVRGGFFNNNPGGFWGLNVSVASTNYSIVGVTANGNGGLTSGTTGSPSGGGIGIDVTAPSSGAVYAANGVVSGCTASGNIGNHGLWINHVSNLTVSGNNFSNNSNQGSGIGCQGNSITMVGNTCNNNAVFGIGMWTGSATGTVFASGGNVIGGNNLLGNTQGPIHDASDKPNTYKDRVLNVKDFGALGDGNTDDTVAIQAAMTAAVYSSIVPGTVYFPSGLYIVTNHLYTYGNVNLQGEAGAEVRLTAAPTYGNYWWIFGASSYGVGSSTTLWSGIVEGLRISCTSGVGTASLRLFNLINVQGAIIRGNTFDITAGGATSFTGAIVGATNASFSPAHTRQNVQILNNTLLANQNKVAGVSGSEGMSQGGATDVKFIGNYISGFGDDSIGAHYCTDVVISNNQMYSNVGRIACDGTVGLIISNNFMQRIQNASGAWSSAVACIYLSATVAGGTSFIASNFTINGNVMITHNDNANSITDAGIKLQGARRGSITGNTVTNPTGDVSAYYWSSLAVAGWVDPEGSGAGYDASGTPSVRNVRIRGNTPPGSTDNYNTYYGGGTNTFEVDHDASLPIDPVAALGQTITTWNGVLNATNSNNFIINLTATRAGATTIINGYNGQEIAVTMQQNATGGFTCPWPNNATLAATALTIAPGANARTTVRFRCEMTAPDTYHWYETGRAV